MKWVIEKFRVIRSLGNAKNISHQKASRSNVNIEAVFENVGESLGKLNINQSVGGHFPYALFQTQHYFVYFKIK